ncbi:hypothetical protein CPC16_008281 [Podila verticillata]|nr:hypothetical protein CPC16_008281 [Podila verticillata]
MPYGNWILNQSSATTSSAHSDSFDQISTFDERIYEFASYFFLMQIFKTTLFYASVYGFSTTVAGISFSTFVGSLVDTTPRLKAVQSFLIAQKMSTVLGCVGFWILLTWFDPSSSTATMTFYQGYTLFALLVLVSATLKLSALGWSISIERDWIVCMCQSNSDLLTKINVNMKRIDLVCKLTSPLVFAALLAQLDAGYCSLTIATWCLFSFCVELWLVRRIWYSSSLLSAPRSDIFYHGDSRKNTASPLLGSLEVYGTGDISEQQGRKGPMSLLRVLQSFRDYRYHTVFLASMSYAIIYINMMSISGTMIGYLQWRGLSAGSIAFLKGICTASELLGTVLMPVLTRYVGLVRGGVWSIWLEVATLMPVLFSIYTDRLPIQVVIFVGMALSRVGVWSFDLVVTQIMQEHIENGSNAGVINGWHYSMMNVFELGQFILTMVWSNPEAYYVPCTLSFGCVVAGALVYSAYVVQIRGHLFHYQRIASTSFLVENGEDDPDIEGWSASPSTSPGEEDLGSGVVSPAGSRSRARSQATE